MRKGIKIAKITSIKVEEMEEVISALGFGPFGVAQINHIDKVTRADKPAALKVYDSNPDILEAIASTHRHPKHFSDIQLSGRVKPVENIPALLKGADHLLVNVNAQAVRTIAGEIAQYIEPKTIITIMAKGIDLESKKLLYEIIEDALEKEGKNNSILQFSGGTIASDLAYSAEKYATSIGLVDERMVAEVAGENLQARESVGSLLHSRIMRVYLNDDIRGVSYNGALKNVITPVVGIIIGRGMGISTQSSFILRATEDIKRFGMQFGAKERTYSSGSPSFMGDLMVSCFGSTRNRELGIMIGKGIPALEAIAQMQAKGQTVEGPDTCKAVHDISQEYGLTVPCFDIAYKILFESLPLEEAESLLMSRPQRHI